MLERFIPSYPKIKETKYHLSFAQHLKKSFSVGYSHGIYKFVNFLLSYTARQTYEKKRYDLHLLECQIGWGDATSQPIIGTLPSEAKWMRNETFDPQNSYTYNRKPIENELQLYISANTSIKGGKAVINSYLKLPVALVQQRLDYQRVTYDAFTHRHDYTFNSTARFRYTRTDKGYTDVEVIYNMSETLSDLLDHLLTLSDTYDPLNTYVGNTALKRAQSHNLEVRYSKNGQKGNNYITRSLNANYNYVYNAIARGFTYDPTMGKRTFMPQNVNGSQFANVGYDTYMYLGKQEKIQFLGKTNLGWQHGVDLITIVNEGNLPTKNVVENWSVQQKLGIAYFFTQSTYLSVSGGVSYNAVRSQKDYFVNQDVWSYQYGVTLKATLPWDIKLSTDLKVYGNRGFTDPAGNKDKLVWNARISRSIKRPNLTFIIDGFDMLHQLSNRSFTINSQGRTEIYRNALPSYFLAHVIWHFNNPRKLTGTN